MATPKERPLDLTIRFSTSTPDLTIALPSPSTTTALTLKRTLRAQLPDPLNHARLRFIHSGKVVADTTSLSRSLSVTLPPPSDGDKSAKAKGKLPVRDPAARVYIHCALGDALTPAELADEAKAAVDADAALLASTPPMGMGMGEGGATRNESTTTPAPRGFDRLLTAGFTTAEVGALRSQFLAIQSHTHTPDTMPTGPELLALEERWLDNGSDAAAGGGGGGDEDADVGGLEDMLWGNLIGFFWPIGAMMWLMREEGIWSRRRQIAVLSGFLVNLTFGFLRVMN